MVLCGTLFLASACTGSFEKYNTDNAGFSPDQQEYDNYKYGMNLEIVQKGIYFNYNWGSGLNWPFQIMQNLNVDMFAGYFHNPKGDFNSSNSVYNLNTGWNSSNWGYTYGYIITALHKAEEINSTEGHSSFLGISKILKVALMHRIADQYGPLVYSTFGVDTGSDPESLQTAYNNFFADLEEGITLLRSWLKDYPDSEAFSPFDIITKTKSFDEWLRFANSLRLRLAMRVSNVDKATASAQAAKCFNSGIGFLEAGTHLIAVRTEDTGYSNPLGEVNKGWQEVFMNASMESFLVGYGDPRLPKFFDKATEEGKGQHLLPIKGKYKGFRQGTLFTHDNYKGHSKSTIAQSTDAVLMTPAEVWFLRAEAALRGMSSENVENCYTTGIRVSCEQWGISSDISSYLQSEETPLDYQDALTAEYNVKATTTITPKWNNDATNEEKLERIITQKWIACYPEGAEAWAEQRRTGYPKLFKVYANHSNGVIDTDVMIRRLPYPVDLTSNQYNQLLQLLDGPDTGATRLWWDAGKNNF